MRDEVFLLGRVLFSLVFAWNGQNHLTHTTPSAQYAEYKRVPSARTAVLLSGLLMIVGSLAVVLGIWMDLAALGLAVLVVIMALYMHRYWEETDPQTLAVERAQFMKNLSLAGGALIIAAVGTYAPYTLTDGVFK
jgi:putative oxidoreductase